MKSNLLYKYSPFLMILGIFTLSVSCSENDVFTGEPQGPFTKINATVSTPDTDVVSGQPFEITINLGDNPNTPEADLLTFSDEVNVEVTAFVPSINKRTRKTVTIPANQNVFVTSMNAPSGDRNPSSAFNKEMLLYLSGITTTSDAEVVGFPGVQYQMVSDTLSINYGESSLLGANAKRLSVVCDFVGPYGNAPLANNLDFIVSRNGVPLTGINTTNTTYKPFYGTLNSTDSSGDTFSLVDVNQRGYISYVNYSDIAAGNYIYKPLAGTTVANSTPHGLEVGDDVSLSNFNSSGSQEIIVQVASVPDPFSFTFNYTTSNIFGSESPFSQVTTNPDDITISSTVRDFWWDPYKAYKAGDIVQIDNKKYYCLKDVSANLAGNVPPSAFNASWSDVRPNINWPDVMQGVIAAPTWNGQAEYKLGDFVVFNGTYFLMNGYVAARTSGNNPNPTQNNSKWIRAMKEYKIEALNYRSTATYTIALFAQKLGGVTTNAPATNIDYRFAVRFPNDLGKTYKGTLSGITTGSANAVTKLKIVRNTVQGTSTYEVTPQ